MIDTPDAIDTMIHDINEYNDLCFDVGNISTRAERIMNEAGVMDTDEFEFSGNLFEAFIWSSTDQGYEYWSSIYKELESYGLQPEANTWVK